MNAPVRFAYANARLHALRNDLFDDVHLSRIAAAPALCVPPPSDRFADLYPPLVRWYATLLRACTPARRALLAMLRRHEVENLKLLWRSAVRGRAVPAHCWRPLGHLASIDPAQGSSSVGSLAERLKRTPYAALARETVRSHGSDLVAAELAFDGWVRRALSDAAVALPDEASAARVLLLSLVREWDLDILRRGRLAYGLDPDFVVELTTVLRREHPKRSLLALAGWDDSAGPLAVVLPPALARACGPVRDWDELMTALRRRRRRECQRLLRAYPFQIAPALAALMLREDQMQTWASLAAAGRGA